MNPEPLVKAVIELAQAQLRLGALLTEALLGLKKRSSDPERPMAEPGAEAVERAAASIQREMLRHKDVGFASLLRTNFPPDEIRRIAKAALEAANDRDIKQ